VLAREVPMLNEKPQLTPEMLVPRLGDALVQSGHITNDQLQKALDLQNERHGTGQSVLLGQALLELGLIDRATLDQAVTEQIIELRSALQSANRTLDRRVRERTEELQQALERLSELGEMKANFVANISHELRTPLTHIKGYLELMAGGALGALTEEQQHALKVSQKATGRLERLIEDLLTFSRASHGEVSFRQETLDIRSLAASAVDGTRARAVDAGVELRLVAAERVPYVQGDGEKILWVLNQLLDNAVKFTPSGGHIMLGLKPEGDSLVLVSVRDTGIGIPESQVQQIFEPFRQLNGSSKRRAGGTGLGLALVRQIVEAHGSVLEVHSVEGQGSTFQFPLLAAPEAKGNEGRPAH
jgi:two-component system, sensor histidine kinase and response regulator